MDEHAFSSVCRSKSTDSNLCIHWIGRGGGGSGGGGEDKK